MQNYVSWIFDWLHDHLSTFYLNFMGNGIKVLSWYENISDKLAILTGYEWNLLILKVLKGETKNIYSVKEF